VDRKTIEKAVMCCRYEKIGSRDQLAFGLEPTDSLVEAWNKAIKYAGLRVAHELLKEKNGP